MPRLNPALFALLGSTFAATAALAHAQDAPPPAALEQSAACKMVDEQLAALQPKAQVASSRRLLGFAAGALQVAGPLVSGLGGSSMGGVMSAVAQQGAMQALQHSAAEGGSEDAKRQQLLALAKAQGC